MASTFLARPGEMHSVAVVIVAVECCSCHTVFGIAKELNDQFKEDHELFTCPRGHQQHYTGASEAERLRALLDHAESRETWERARAERSERQAATARGQVTKIKNKVARGICPCCEKKFPDLTRHMALAHPEFEAADV